MSATQQQIQGLLSQYTQSQAAQGRKMSSAASNSRSLAPGSSLLVPLGTPRKHDKSPVSTPERPRKRIKLEQKPPNNRETAELRQLVCSNKVKEMMEMKKAYREKLLELFFLQNMGNLVDYFVWRKKPDSKVYQFVRNGKLDSDDEEDWCSEKSIVGESRSRSSTPLGFSSAIPALQGGSGDQNKSTRIGNLFSQYQKTNGSSSNGIGAGELESTLNNQSVTNTPVIKSEVGVTSMVSSSLTSALKMTISTQPKTAAALNNPTIKAENHLGTQEAIVERAKQEAAVIQRVSELRKEGMWSSRRLPKVQEQSRNKSHWDYLLAEMQWMAADFAQERKWKKIGARKVANMISMYHKEKQEKLLMREQNEVVKLKQISSNIAKMVKEFWSNIETIVEYKQQCSFEEKKRKAVNMKLRFIADHQEKYPSSPWLGSVSPSEKSTSSVSSSLFSPHKLTTSTKTYSKDAQTNLEDTNYYDIKELQSSQFDLPVHELIQELPVEYQHLSNVDTTKRAAKRTTSDAFLSSDDSNYDNEETLDIEEMDYNSDENTQELEQLHSEAELPLDELVNRYYGSYDNIEHLQMPPIGDGTSSDEMDSDTDNYCDDNDEYECTTCCATSESENDDEVVTLTDDASTTDIGKSTGKDLADLISTARHIQPTGHTLDSKIKTCAPSLLKYELREYQLIGLNWLCSLHDNNLNGVLADEIGLGKTVQAIALLAHLACKEGDWGPHLIVVPTVDLISWESEFKKWCPAFRILSFLGSKKEIKSLKQIACQHVIRPINVCITSYKLAIQHSNIFRKKKWKYYILDEAQNVKDFKSPRWQSLLNLNCQHRLVLTSEPLKNSVAALWSLLQFLMPHLFKSYTEIKDWFARSLGSLIEGSPDYNDHMIKKLQKTIQTFVLRREKRDVMKKMPKKFEHIMKCSLSKRQRFLYDDFMSRAKTKEMLSSAHCRNVLSVVLQLRKVCNHPNLVEPRPVLLPFQMRMPLYRLPSLVIGALENNLWYSPNLNNFCITNFELNLSAFVAHRIRRLQTPYELIEEIDDQPESLPRPPALEKPLKFVFENNSPLTLNSGRSSPFIPIHPGSHSPMSFSRKSPGSSCTPTPSVDTTQRHNLAVNSTQSPIVSSPSSIVLTSGSNTQTTSTSQPITVQIQNTPQGTRLMIPSGQLSQLPGYIQIVQTSSGQQIIATSQPPPNSTVGGAIMNGPTSAGTFTTASQTPKPTTSIQLPTASYNADKPVLRVSPLTTREVLPSSITASGVHTTKSVSSICSVTPLGKRRGETFSINSLDGKKCLQRKDTLQRIANVNKRNCELRPILGMDLIDAVNALSETQNPDRSRWHGLGYIHCYKVQSSVHPSVSLRQTSALKSIVHTPLSHLNKLKGMLEACTFVVPRVASCEINLRRHSQSVFPSNKLLRDCNVLRNELVEKSLCLGKIETNMSLNFPETRLLQHDCGKLQSLDLLLKKLKSENHCVLLFTQMNKMLDILEGFLNYRNHLYVRLDGKMKLDERQNSIDKFNSDKRYFVFLLSTRSGGLNMNITRADTVICYDSDWSSSFDDMVQGQCDKISWTKDVHIYKLVSEESVEEKLVRKGDQKRLIGDAVVEGGNINIAAFKSSVVQELFQGSSNTQGWLKEKVDRKSPIKANSLLNNQIIEQILYAVEDKDDVYAAKSSKAIQMAELAEFDEEIAWEDKESKLDDSFSHTEHEVNIFEKDLTPIERYAVGHIEKQSNLIKNLDLEKAIEKIEAAKKQWELTRFKTVREEEIRRAEFEEDDLLFTYCREDSTNPVFICDESDEKMPMWAPPTPPQDDNDIHLDMSMCFLYEQTIMTETQLPPVYIKKEHKRVRVDPAVAVTRKHKVRKEEQARVPKSLFDRPMSLLRRDAKLKLKQGFGIKPLKPTPMLSTRPMMDTGPEHPEWLIHEDWALLQAVQNLLELPLSLCTGSPAHIPNWDLVADVVNSASRTYRAPKQCKYRYENVIVPREEGRILYDVNPRKQKKTKGIYKVYHTKNNRPMKTCQLYAQDNSQSLSTLYGLRFDSSKCIASKRTPTMRPTLANPTLKNPKHAAVLGENGISYEIPLTPIQVAQNRAERIAKEKKELAVQKTLVVQQNISSTTTAAQGQTATVVTQTVAGQPQLTVVQAHQQIHGVATAAGTTIVPAAQLQKSATVSLQKSLGTGSIVVNTAGGVPANAFATINRKLTAGQTVVGSLAQNIVTSTSIATTASGMTAVRAAPARTIATSMTVQELNAAIQNQVRQNQTTGQLITTTSLTQSQLQRMSALPQVASNVQQKFPGTTSAKLTPQHLLMIQRQQQLKQQRISGLVQTQVAQTATVQRSAMPVTTPLITSISGALTPQGTRLQVPKQALTQVTQPRRTLTEAEMAVFLRQKGNPQRIQTISGGTQQVQQVQVSGQGAMARLTTGQLIAGTPQITTSQPVATLVKTVATQGGNIPSVTIPVSAVSLGISVPQKPVQGRATPLVRQIMGNKKQTVSAAQLQAHKVATLGGMQPLRTPGSGTPLIIPQKHHNQQVIVQQIQQLVKHQSQANQIHTPSNSATVIATQLVTQAGQTVARLSVPAGTTTVRTLAPPNVNVSSVGNVAPQTLITQTVSNPSTVTLNPGIATGLVKNLQEVVVSPQKAGIQQTLKTVPQATTIRSLQAGITLNPSQTTVGVQQMQPTKQITPPPGK